MRKDLQLNNDVQKVILFLAVVSAVVGVYYSFKRLDNALSAFAQG